MSIKFDAELRHEIALECMRRDIRLLRRRLCLLEQNHDFLTEKVDGVDTHLAGVVVKNNLECPEF